MELKIKPGDWVQLIELPDRPDPKRHILNRVYLVDRLSLDISNSRETLHGPVLNGIYTTRVKRVLSYEQVQKIIKLGKA